MSSDKPDPFLGVVFLNHDSIIKQPPMAAIPQETPCQLPLRLRKHCAFIQSSFPNAYAADNCRRSACSKEKHALRAGKWYLQVGVLHQLELLLDDVQLLLLRFDVRLQNACPLLQLLLQLMHHAQWGWEVVHGLQGRERALAWAGPTAHIHHDAFVQGRQVTGIPD